ncbi:hypothetical protein F4604DRAFT_1721785, partial [Suillus subluteus]
MWAPSTALSRVYISVWAVSSSAASQEDSWSASGTLFEAFKTIMSRCMVWHLFRDASTCTSFGCALHCSCIKAN